MENAQRKSVLFVPASFKEGDIDILSTGVQLCTLFSIRRLDLLLVTGSCVSVVLAMLASDEH